MSGYDTRIPSFFKHSYVKPQYVYDENNSVFLENILTDYDTPNYVRIMKKFTTPDYECNSIEEEQFKNVESQKRFFLRCYLPKLKLAQEKKENRIKDVVILINGLNETDRYDFYDLLGSHFAANEIACILLPTPYHLNRKVDNKPTDIAVDAPLLFYYSFKRTIHELESLCDKIRGLKNDEEDLDFYNTCFARGEGVKIRITTLGFSLGGLKALGAFVLDLEKKQDRYQSCITFNSTADPFLADPRRIGVDQNKWQRIKEYINTAINHNKVVINTDNDFYRIFQWLYNRNKNIECVDILKKHSNRFLMVQSAADKIVSNAHNGNIIDPEHGLNSIVFAGVDHIVTRDEKWHQYMKPVTDHLVGFIRNSNDSSYSHQRLEDDIKSLLINTEFYKNIKSNYKRREEIEEMNFTIEMLKSICEEIRNKLNDESQKKFIELYYISKVYYPKFPELLGHIIDPKKRNSTYVNLKTITELKCGPDEAFLTIAKLKGGTKITANLNSSELWIYAEVVTEDAEPRERVAGYVRKDLLEIMT